MRNVALYSTVDLAVVMGNSAIHEKSCIGWRNAQKLEKVSILCHLYISQSQWQNCKIIIDMYIIIQQVFFNTTERNSYLKYK